MGGVKSMSDHYEEYHSWKGAVKYRMKSRDDEFRSQYLGDWDVRRPADRQDRAESVFQNLIRPKRNDLWDDPNPLFNYYRAGMDCICAWCGAKYIDHPVERRRWTFEQRKDEYYGAELHVLCNTDRVKL